MTKSFEPADTVLFPLFTNFTKIFQNHFQETEDFSLVKDLVLPTRKGFRFSSHFIDGIRRQVFEFRIVELDEICRDSWEGEAT